MDGMDRPSCERCGKKLWSWTIAKHDCVLKELRTAPKCEGDIEFVGGPYDGKSLHPILLDGIPLDSSMFGENRIGFIVDGHPPDPTMVSVYHRPPEGSFVAHFDRTERFESKQAH